MSKITICVGDRLRRRRMDLGYTQEHLAELADVHPTYIGQVERGEKNVTIESLEKICLALDFPMDELFYNIHTFDAKNKEAKACYDLIVRQPLKDQKQLCLIIESILKFRS